LCELNDIKLFNYNQSGKNQNVAKTKKAKPYVAVANKSQASSRLTAYAFCSRLLLWAMLNTGFYARKQLLLSARPSHRNSVCPSVCPSVWLSVRHTGGSVKNGAS